jgi:hypothetical protein
LQGPGHGVNSFSVTDMEIADGFIPSTDHCTLKVVEQIDFTSKQRYLPYSIPSLCSCKRDCLGICLQLPQRYAPDFVVHVVDIECLDRSPNIDNRLHIGVSSSPLAIADIQNAPAPPAMVPSRNLLISMTFFTVPEAKQNRNQVLLRLDCIARIPM